MKIGDLVHDSTFGLNGVIVDKGFLGTADVPGRHRVWTILYEDGQTEQAFDNELEVIS
jgi:hypothetical protein